MEDFIGELLDRIDASGPNFSEQAYEASARKSSRCCDCSSSYAACLRRAAVPRIAPASASPRSSAASSAFWSSSAWSNLGELQLPSSMNG